MRYLVEGHASMERGNTIDTGEGPGPIFAKIVERFRPEAFYGNPSRRQVFMVVELETPAKMAELMYIFTWFAGAEPPRDAARDVYRSDHEREAHRVPSRVGN